MLVREVAHRDLVRARVELRHEPAVRMRERDREPGADRAVELDGLGRAPSPRRRRARAAAAAVRARRPRTRIVRLYAPRRAIGFARGSRPQLGAEALRERGHDPLPQLGGVLVRERPLRRLEDGRERDRLPALARPGRRGRRRRRAGRAARGPPPRVPPRSGRRQRPTRRRRTRGPASRDGNVITSS